MVGVHGSDGFLCRFQGAEQAGHRILACSCSSALPPATCKHIQQACCSPQPPTQLSQHPGPAPRSRSLAGCCLLVCPQIQFYNFEVGGFAENTGHFTQLIWRDSVRIGCAANLRCAYKTYICQYQAPGQQWVAVQPLGQHRGLGHGLVAVR